MVALSSSKLSYLARQRQTYPTDSVRKLQDSCSHTPFISHILILLNARTFYLSCLRHEN